MSDKQPIVLNAFMTRNFGRNIQHKIGDYVISIGISDTHYCSNNRVRTDFSNKEEYICEDCELAIYADTEQGEWLTKEVWSAVFNEELCDDVVGYVTFDQYLKVLNYVFNKVNNNQEI